MNRRTAIFSLALICLIFQAAAQPLFPALRALPAAAADSNLTLASAVVCEGVKDLSPQYPAIVFSTTVGRASCFCVFDPVPQDTHIYHSWYYRDKLTTRIKLALKSPRWSTFSSIQLRESDVGPWRVEITNRSNLVIKVLRFSVTE